MGCKHRYLWLGSYQSDEQFQKMLARNIGQASGYASQKGLVKGFDQILDKDSVLDTIGVVSCPTYPKYPKANVEEIRWSRTGRSSDMTIGYLNIKYITKFPFFQPPLATLLIPAILTHCKKDNTINTI